MEYFGKRYHPPGTPPGTLVPSRAAPIAQLEVRLLDYTAEELTEHALISAAECRPFLERPSVTWIDIKGEPVPETLETLGEIFGLHPLALEDVANRGQRPKVDFFDRQLFLILARPQVRGERVGTEQLSFFAGENYVISFHNGHTDPFEPVRERLRRHGGRFRARGADYLLYALIDVVIDEGFPLLEHYGERVERLEEQLLSSPTKATLHQLHALRRELLLLRRTFWPQREVLNSLMRGDFEALQDETAIYLHDCYDHVVQIIDLVETYRDMTSSMLEVYLSSLSNRLNETMRVLTVIATIFIPLTFIVGVYGMNFSNEMSPWAMPELHWYYAYPMLWLVMIAVAAGMLIYFRRKRWL